MKSKDQVPDSTAGCLLNIGRDGGSWYSKVQQRLSASALNYVVSHIRATYGDSLYTFRPDKQWPCNTKPTLFATGPIDALTVYFMDASHVALNCTEIRGWNSNLTKNLRLRAIQNLHRAVPEEEALNYKPDGEPNGSGRISAGKCTGTHDLI